MAGELSGRIRERRRAFGEHLRGLRRVRRLSQEALAVLAGLHHAYGGSVERSSRKIWPDSIRALADALEVTAADLLTLARLALQAPVAPETGRD